MILIGGDQSSWRKICPSATLSITYPIWTGLVLNPVLYGERPPNNRLSQGIIHRVIAEADVVVYFWHYQSICLEGSRNEKIVKIACLLAKVRTPNFPHEGRNVTA